MTLREFARMCDVDVEEIKDFQDVIADALPGADEDVLQLEIEGDDFLLYRMDNPWNEPVTVIKGKVQDWNLNESEN